MKRSTLTSWATAIIYGLFAYVGGISGLQADTDSNQAAGVYDLSLEELMSTPVSTAYFKEKILDTAATVSIILPEDWERRGARRLQDAYSHLPGVVALPNFLGSSSLRIRGYAQSSARGIATLWDGVSLTSFNLGTSDVDRPNIQLGTLSRIEVIRGPGSALLGSDAFHGTVSLTSFEADTDQSIISSAIGSNGYLSGAFQKSQGLTDGGRVNTSIAYSGRPDQNRAYEFTNDGLRGFGERDQSYQSMTAVSKYRSNTNKPLVYNLGFYYDANDSNEFQGQGPQGNTPGRDVSSVNSNLRMLKTDALYRFDDARHLNFNAYYWNQRHVFEQPVSETREIYIDGAEGRTEGKVVYTDEASFGHSQFSVGVSLRRDLIISQKRRIFDASTIFVDADLPFSGTSRTISSVFLDGKTRFLGEDWIVRYGLRYDDYSDFGSKLTPRLGLVYQPGDHYSIKALYGNAFRAATAVEIGGSPFITGDPSIRPEQIDTFELIYQYKSENAQVGVNIFHSKFMDAITTIDSDGDGFEDRFGNSQSSDSRGVELTYDLHKQSWRINTSASYVSSSNNTENLAYEAFPRYLLFVGVGHRFHAGLELYLSNRAQLDTTEGPPRPGLDPKNITDYWRTDLNISKQAGRYWRWNVNARNLFDRKNRLPSLVNTYGGIPAEEFSIYAGFSRQL